MIPTGEPVDLAPPEADREEHALRMKKNLILFENVDMIEPDQIRWDRIRYQRNNQSYRMLMNI